MEDREKTDKKIEKREKKIKKGTTQIKIKKDRRTERKRRQ